MIAPNPRRRAFPALLAALAWAAVLLQLVLSVRLGLANGKSVVDGLVVFFGFFTVLTNIFVALVAAARALNADQGLARPSVIGCATTAILIVGMVYHLLLRKIWSPQGAQWLADMLLHYAVPVGALLHWLAMRHTQRLPPWAPLAWCAYPLAYFAYVLLRGEWLGSYPYPFIDVTALGYPQMLLNSAGLLAVFIAVGFGVLGLSRLAARGGRA